MSPILSARGGLSANAYGWGAASAAGGAFESIATATGTGSSGTITFSSIPSTFKHLQIRGIWRTTYAGNPDFICAITANSDTGSNYAWHNLEGNASTVSASGGASDTRILSTRFAASSVASNTLGVVILDVLDYTSTSKYKTFRLFGGVDDNGTAPANKIHLRSGLWLSTSAINTITFTTIGSDNWTTQTSLALYGIKESA
jgi:hypothetical protein